MSTKYTPNDAVVTYPDAEVWAAELLKMPPKSLEADLMELEPAVLGVALHSANYVMTLLVRQGVEGLLAQRAADEVLRTGAVCCALMRRGYRKFLPDLIEPAAPAVANTGSAHLQPAKEALVSHPPRKRRPSAFALAQRDGSVAAEITPDDVLEARPEWSRTDAERFLDTHAAAVGRAMVRAGVGEVLRQIGGLDRAE